MTQDTVAARDTDTVSVTGLCEQPAPSHMASTAANANATLRRVLMPAS